MDTKITVIFKERYMPEEVTRTCVNMTRQQIIEQYSLRDLDIEYYRFVEE